MKIIDKREKRRLNLIKKELKTELIKQYGTECYYCGDTFFEDQLTLDHVVPVKTITKFVKNRKERKAARLLTYANRDTSNLVLACGPCNVRKGDSNVTREVFRRKTLRNEKGIVFKDQIYKGVQSIVYPENPIVES